MKLFIYNTLCWADYLPVYLLYLYVFELYDIYRVIVIWCLVLFDIVKCFLFCNLLVKTQ